MRFLTIIASLLLLCCTPALAQEDTLLQAQLQTAITPFGGKVALFATDLRSGKTVAVNADTPVPTASVIKLTILYDALKDVEEGKASLADRLVLTKANQVEGSGVLQFFDTPLNLTLKDALWMMVIQSDNTATNLAIDRLGLQNIDDRIRSLGLKNTWLYKKVFMPPSGPVPADQKTFGLGKTTAREMASVMAHFATCDTIRKDLCDLAVRMLKNQSDQAAIPRYLSGITVGNKTGALEDVRNDVAIVYAKNGPIVISAFTYDIPDKSWSPDNSAQLLMGRLARAIVNAWQ
ncbi:MAG TPA: serine hydrolase [Candidatus Baltobacteraceae bacterium]